MAKPPLANVAAAADTPVAAEGLTKRFGHFTAVAGVSFSVRRGEIFGFLGPNGAGKSTTIRMLCGLLASTAGRATVGGFDINREPEKVRQNLGYMSQKFNLYRDLTVRENLAFFGGVYGLAGERLRRRLGAVAALTGLEGLETHLTGTLSGAHQQRLALAAAILHEPPILFLDEPTSGIDPISRRQFWALIQQLAGEGVTVLVTTHFMDEAEFCGRIGFINAGRLIALDTPAALKRDAVRDELFELAVPTFRGVREALAGIAGLVASAFFGARLHLYCRPGACTAAGLETRLRGGGIAGAVVTAIRPGLEDAFIRLAAAETPPPPP
ncbi:MAG: ABC transporter ATP-binding protein [Lentisphaeria bacterium]